MDQSTRTDSGTRADNNVNAITSANACISYFSLRPGAPAPSSAKSRTTVYWLPLAIGVSPHQGHRTGTATNGESMTDTMPPCTVATHVCRSHSSLHRYSRRMVHQPVHVCQPLGVGLP